MTTSANNLDVPALIPRLHSIIFWRWRKSDSKVWSEAFVVEVNGEFINVSRYESISPVWINVNDIEWRYKI